MPRRYLTPRSAAEFCAFSLVLVERASDCAGRTDFLAEMAGALLDFASCDAAELWLPADEDARWEASRAPDGALRVERYEGRSEAGLTAGWGAYVAERCEAFLRGERDRAEPVALHIPPDEEAPASSQLTDGRPLRSLLALPLRLEDGRRIVVFLAAADSDRFRVSEVELYPLVGQALESAWRAHSTRASLTERVKELTCLLGLSKLAALPGVSLGEALQGVAALLPPAWQYPPVCRGRIVFDGTSFESADFRDGPHHQRADVIVDGVPRGFVEVVYTEDCPPADEGAFLADERNLIDAVARQVALLVERRHAAAEEERLREQLRHADRLATIGQLAAGVAHELNEPLGGVLGFAELAQKSEALPDDVARDLGRIVDAALHARTVVRKLRLFARQSEPETAEVDLNALVREGLYLVESRCARQAVEIVLVLTDPLPPIRADRGQVHQVLVNLVVNAVQAMPDGGTLTVSTASQDAGVALQVADTGCGIPAALREDILLPFFTTKDVDEGTGLGLSVVHGIMSAHGGQLRFESEEGVGSRFEALFPRWEDA